MIGEETSVERNTLTSQSMALLDDCYDLMSYLIGNMSDEPQKADREARPHIANHAEDCIKMADELARAA
ncbi:hypothetical protein LCGC14_1391810, partial [marine sediment metagenome]